jgi:inner membrane protein
MVENTQITSASVTRVAIEPYPVNPFHWHAILETANFYQTAEIHTRTETIESDPYRDVLYKPTPTMAVEAAKRTSLGQVFLDWGSWAVVRDIGQYPIPGLAPPQLGANRRWTTVQFTDLRFDYSFLGGEQASRQSSLSGSVYIVDNRDDGGEMMDGREQR